MYDYPDGPVPCDDDPDCKRVIYDYHDTWPLFTYIYWGICILILVGWWVYRRKWVKDREDVRLRREITKTNAGWDQYRASTQDLGAIGTADVQTYGYGDYGSTIDEDDETKGLNQPVWEDGGSGQIVLEGYSESIAGEVVFLTIIGVSLYFIFLFCVVIVDFYWECQFTSVDTQCIYGSYPVFGNDRTNAKYFFVLWWCQLFWFGPLFWLRKHIRNWCRLPVPLSQAGLIHVTKVLSADLMVANPSPTLLWFMEWRKTWLPERDSTREKTVPVVQQANGTRMIEFECTRYLIESESLALPTQPVLRCNECHNRVETGLTTEQAKARLDLLGPNIISFKLTSLCDLTKAKMFNGFYLYMFMMYQVWIWFGYLVVGVIDTGVVCVSAAINVVLAHNGEKTIAKLCEFSMDVLVMRSGEWLTVNSADLVPGDIIKVQEDWTAPADLAILQGSAVCDEAGLTGESMPVGKAALPISADVVDTNRHKSSMIYSGTKVLQAGVGSSPFSDAVAVVVGTGVNTNKGELVSAILFPTPTMFKYDEEFPLYFFVLLCYAAVCCGLSVYFVNANGSSSLWIAKWAYGIFTTSEVLSPMLPIALVVGENMASKRLHKNRIFCMDAKRIAIAGKIRVFCFDKTGTLTHEGLDFLGVQEINRLQDGQAVGFDTPVEYMEVVDGEEKPATSSIESCNQLHLKHLVATCNNLKHYGDRMVGNQVEVKMFESCYGAKLEEGNAGMRTVTLHDGTKLEIVRTFEFDHERMTMSVVVRQGDHCCVYTKGASEKIGQLCNPTSVPPKFEKVHKGHSLAGCYVLGAAWQSLGKLSDSEILDLTRDGVEAKQKHDDGAEGEGMQLLGLLRFRNELKPDTKQAITELKDGDVRVIMLTGDNAQCGAYIARESGMVADDQIIIFGDDKDGVVEWTHPGTKLTASCRSTKVDSIYADVDVAADVAKIEAIMANPDEDHGTLFERVELAVTQKALDLLISSGAIDNLILHIRIFSRLRPDGKVAVIDKLWTRQLIVGMCGDGGNDCGALRAAHAGIALSDAEASVVSPFTSSDKSVRSVVDLLREGRATLATNFASFKFLVTYGQLFSVLNLMNFQMGVMMCKMSYYMIDLVGVLVMTYVMTTSKPADKLPSTRPPSSLIGFTSLASVIGAQVIHISFLCGALLFVMVEPGYVDWPASSILNERFFQEKWFFTDNWETDAMYFGVYLPWITAAVTFSYGHDWRQPVWKNYQLMGSWTALMVFHFYLMASTNNTLTEAFHVASIEFGPWDNDVWAVAEDSQPPMEQESRIQLMSIALSSCLCATLFEKLVVTGPLKRLFKTPKHERPGYVHLRI